MHILFKIAHVLIVIHEALEELGSLLLQVLLSGRGSGFPVAASLNTVWLIQKSGIMVTTLPCFPLTALNPEWF